MCFGMSGVDEVRLLYEVLVEDPLIPAPKSTAYGQYVPMQVIIFYAVET